MTLAEMTEQERAQVLESTKDTLKKIALMEAAAAQPPPRMPADMAWVIGKAVKNGLVLMKENRLLPDDFRPGDITVDFDRRVSQPVFRVQVEFK